MKDFNKYKTEISLAEFLIDNYNFQESRDHGSTKRHPRVKNQETGEVYIIKKNSLGQYTYWNPHDSVTKGKTILDFMQERLRNGNHLPSLYQVAVILDNYIASGKIVRPENSNYYLTKNHTEVSVSEFEKELKELKDNTFLKERGVDPSTLETDYFKNVFFERDFLQGYKIHKNVVVKLFNKEGLAGLSHRNTEFKGCLGKRADALAATNPNHERKIDIYFVGESMLDAISHYEINHAQLADKNIVYLTSEGNFTEGQIELLQHSIDRVHPGSVIGIFDNDIAGQCFNLNMIGNIHMNGVGEGIKTELNIDRKSEEITIKIAMADGVSKTKTDYGEQFFSEGIQGDFSYKRTKIIGKSTELVMKFPLSMENVNTFIEKVRQFKFNNKDVYREIPLTNDFNDDLRAMKGIHEEWKIEKEGGVMKGVRLDEKKNEFQMTM